MVLTVGATLGRFAAWCMRQIVEPDPWEPAIGEGQYLIRERNVGEWLPVGKALAVCDSAAEVVEWFAQHPEVERYFVTRKLMGQCETGDEKEAWRLLGVVATYRHREPELSPEQVAALLSRREAEAA